MIHINTCKPVFTANMIHKPDYRLWILAMTILLSSILPVHAVLGANKKTKEPTYLAIVGEPVTFSEHFKPMPKGSDRQMAFSVVIMGTLYDPVEKLRAEVERVLDKAEQTGYPVLIHLDDWNGNFASSDPELVEWTDWPAKGQKYGPVVKRRWINWGSWVMLEAPRNYESPKLRADIKNRLENWILPPITARLKKWKAEGREYLFAGLVTGWESGYYTMKGMGAKELAPDQKPTFWGVTFNDNEDEINTGYAALSSRGYTASSVKRLALKKNKSEDQIIKELMADVLKSYTTFWTRICSKNGVPKDRIYTHYTAVSSLEESKSPVPFKDGRVLPLKCTTNPYSRPGVTAADFVIDVDKTANTFKKLGHPAWGAVEVEFTAATRSEDGALKYLNKLADSGAKVACIYGWWEPTGNQYEANTAGVINAIHRWLANK